MERDVLVLGVLVAGVIAAIFALLTALASKWIGENMREGRVKHALLVVRSPEAAWLGFCFVMACGYWLFAA